MSIEELLWARRMSYDVLEREAWLLGHLYSTLALSFDMEAQTQSNWCWAATAKSTSTFYRPSSTWTQCRVAGAELGRTDCCDAPVPGACNVPWYLDRALTRTMNFVSVDGPVTVARLRTELQAGRVIGARIGWAGGGGHFMVIYGVSRAGEIDYLHIDDPIYGKSQPSLDTFRTAYQGSGSWTTTYFTQSDLVVMKLKPYLLAPIFIRKIWEARPLLNMAAGSDVRTPENLAPTLAHPIYVVGLDELTDGPQRAERAGAKRARGAKRPAPAKELLTRASRTPAAVRVIELRGTEPYAFFDVNTNEADPKVLQASAGGPYVAQLAPALSLALRSVEQLKGPDRELSLLRIPALYVDALWLHASKPADDLFIPVHAPFLGLEQKAYTAKDFLTSLREAAASRSADHDDRGA